MKGLGKIIEELLEPTVNEEVKGWLLALQLLVDVGVYEVLDDGSVKDVSRDFFLGDDIVGGGLGSGFALFVSISLTTGCGRLGSSALS